MWYEHLQRIQKQLDCEATGRQRSLKFELIAKVQNEGYALSHAQLNVLDICIV